MRRRSHAQKISAGKEALPGEFPYQVQIKHKNDGSHWCAGTILTNYLILTAAHCLYDKSPADFLIVAGQNTPSETIGITQTLDIREAIIHENFNDSIYENDIALLVLKGTLRFDRNAGIGIARIPKGNVELRDSAVVSGWGYVPELKLETAVTLRKAMVTIFNTTVCANEWYQLYSDTKDETGRLCALGKTEGGFAVQDACSGDSGGPLTCTHEQERWSAKKFVCGIVSSGPSCGEFREEDNRSGLYVNVSAYYDWIMNQTYSYREQYRCPQFYFRCCNNLCVPLDSLCDNFDDCGDNSDEMAYDSDNVGSSLCHSKDVQRCSKAINWPDDTLFCWRRGPLLFIVVLVTLAVLITCVSHITYASYFAYQRVNLFPVEPPLESTAHDVYGYNPSGYFPSGNKPADATPPEIVPPKIFPPDVQSLYPKL